MIPRLANPNLWSSWDAMPTIILIPNQGDGQRFYAMSSFRYVNADASAGSLRVRVTDLRRHSIARFDYDDCSGSDGGAVRDPVYWNGAGIADLEGELLRLEFRFENSDLFAFEPT